MANYVLHVVESLEPQAGSLAVSLRGLFGVLRTRGLESQAITLDHNRTATDGISHTRFESEAATRLVRTADVVHLHGWGTELFRIMADTARKAGTPYVISPCGALSEWHCNRKGWLDKLRGFLWEKKLVYRAAVVTAQNGLEQRALEADGFNSNVRVLPYGLGMSDYETATGAAGHLPAAPADRCLLLLGPIHPVEGLAPLMQAFAEIGTDADGWGIVIAGQETGDWRKMLEAAVRRKGGGDRVLFTAAPDVDTQRAWLARASVLAAPSLNFRCPVSIMQAVATGVVVIASDRAAPDGLHDVIQVCPPRREKLREALRGVFRLSDAERASLSQKAHKTGRSLFDWSVLAEQYTQLYRDIA